MELVRAYVPSGHETRASFEIHSKNTLREVEEEVIEHIRATLAPEHLST